MRFPRLVTLAGLVAISGAGATAAEAAEASELRPGARVRLRLTDGRKATGELAEVRSDQLRLSQGPAVPFDRLARLEVDQGKRRLWRQGAVVGGALGALAGIGACVLPEPAGSNGDSIGSQAACTTAVTVAFAGLGALGGLLIVKDRWGEVALEPRPSVRGGGAAVRVAWR